MWRFGLLNICKDAQGILAGIQGWERGRCRDAENKEHNGDHSLVHDIQLNATKQLNQGGNSWRS